MNTICNSIKRTNTAHFITVHALKGPFPSENEFDAKLRTYGFRPATKAERDASRKAQARITLLELAD